MTGESLESRVRTAIAPLVTAVGGELTACAAGQVLPDGGATADTVAGPAIPIEWDGVPIGVVRLPQLHGSMDRLLATVEAELGGPLPELSREQQQAAIRRLDELGAFTLRRAVEDVARAIGVSRFTVYNYLNARYR